MTENDSQKEDYRIYESIHDEFVVLMAYSSHWWCRYYGFWCDSWDSVGLSNIDY